MTCRLMGSSKEDMIVIKNCYVVNIHNRVHANCNNFNFSSTVTNQWKVTNGDQSHASSQRMKTNGRKADKIAPRSQIMYRKISVNEKKKREQEKKKLRFPSEHLQLTKMLQKRSSFALGAVRAGLCELGERNKRTKPPYASEVLTILLAQSKQYSRCVLLISWLSRPQQVYQNRNSVHLSYSHSTILVAHKNRQ